MAVSITVTLNTSLLARPIHIQGLVANASPLTHISRRLANQLNLNQLRDIYVQSADDYDYESPLKWKVSVVPLIVSHMEGREDTAAPITCLCFPVINMQDEDAYYDIVIGRDILCQPMQKFIIDFSKDYAEPTRGPSFDSSVDFFGGSMELADATKISTNSDEFFELCCSRLTTVSRIAINKVVKQIIVVFSHSNRIFSFTEITKEVEGALEHAITTNDEDSVTNIFQMMKEQFNYAEIDGFPENAVLANFPLTTMFHGRMNTISRKRNNL